VRYALLLAVSCACTVIADFPDSRLDEVTDALCGNELDDDGDGLTDCADWTCHDQDVCCTTPSVVLEDAFEGDLCALDACDLEQRDCAPDPARWTRWGAPYPFLCEDALAFHKNYATCYPVGALSTATMHLEPGLRVEAEVSGQPELVGQLEIGLTRQDTVTDGTEACAEIAPIPTMISVLYVADGAGVRFIATLAAVPVAEVRLPDVRERTASVWIDQDHTIHFAVDDEEFAAARDMIPPGEAIEARLVVSGRGSAAHLEHVRVLEGNRCEAPAGWTPAATATPLDPAPDDAWDSFERRTPSATLDDDDQVHLRYVGCAALAGNPTCSFITIAVGDAVAPPQGAFERPEAPFVVTNEVVAEGFFAIDVAVVEDDNVMYYGLDDYEQDDIGADRLARCELLEGAVVEASIEVVLPRDVEPGAWDGRHLCCPTVIARGDERWLYYAGRADGDPAWHIGLAISTAGGAFVRQGLVLSPGQPGVDTLGVTQPWVLYDDTRELYRMWYTAISTLGRTAIGYAVSTDGRDWHKFPDNPVVSAEQVGLELDPIGSPTVIDDGGRLRMWIHGRAPGAVAKTIYELENLGGDPPAP